jgi:hypothetical protein
MDYGNPAPSASNNVDASTSRLASQLAAQEERQQQQQIASAEKAAKSLTSMIGGGTGGMASGGISLLGMLPGLFGFAGGGMINGDGTPTSDSNLALVSDGEYIVNAAAASKNKALLSAINSGKAPSFRGASQAAFLSSNSYSPSVNVHVEGGAADRQLAAKIANHVNDAVNRTAPIGFRSSGPQQHASAASSLSKAHSKNS